MTPGTPTLEEPRESRPADRTADDGQPLAMLLALAGTALAVIGFTAYWEVTRATVAGWVADGWLGSLAMTDAALADAAYTVVQVGSLGLAVAGAGLLGASLLVLYRSRDAPGVPTPRP
jgi:hypothetical protein